MKKHVLVDITAAMEYAQKQTEEYAKQKVEEDRERYNSTHVRKIKEATIDDLSVNFQGLMFSYGFYGNGYRTCDSACFNVPIEDFIVNADEAIEMFYAASDKYVEACQENK